MNVVLPVLVKTEPSPAQASIIITCYNQARFLAAAIKSATEQTIISEVIVVDDGSTDDTSAVAQSFPHVRYVFQSNQGLAAARNTGLAQVSCQYVCFLDADDILLPRAVESALEAFEQAPECAFVYGDSLDIDAAGNIRSEPRGPRVRSDHYRALLQSNFIGMHAAVLYRRDILRAAGGFDTRLGRCEDYELYLRITRRFPVREHAEIVACYRQHDLNMSRDITAMLDAAVSVIRMQEPYIRANRDLRHAAARGVANWREYYGELIWHDFKSRLRTNGFTCDTRRLLKKLLLRCPRKTTVHLLRAAMHRFRNSTPLTPVSRQFGFDRGQPVDRYFIEHFLGREASKIRGAVLEIGDAAYTRRFGGGGVTSSDVLHIVRGTEGATIISDLSDPAHCELRPNAFDCIILTQTLQFIYDLRAAIEAIFRTLRPGGYLLATIPGISQICRDQADRESDCWRFTPASASRMFGEYFGKENISVESHGNVRAATAFLYGRAVSELSKAELTYHDPDYPLIISVKAVKGTNNA